MKVTLDIPSLFVSYGLFLGLTLAVVFLLLRRGNRWANLFLGGILLIFSLFMLHDTLWELKVYDWNPHWVRFTSPLGFLVGPLILFYVKACVEEDFRLPSKWWLHGIAFVVDATYMLPFWFGGVEGKYQYIHALNDPDSRLPAELVISVIVKLIHSAIYLGVSIHKIRSYIRNLKERASNLDRRFHQWLYTFAISLVILFAFLLLMVITGWNSHFETLSSLGFLLFILTVQITAFLKPEIFYSFPEPIPPPEKLTQEQAKYQNSGLDEEQKQAIVRRLEAHMVEERPYLDPDLTLSKLADQLDLPSYQLSQVVNEILGQNFMDLVNSYRVEEVKKLLLDPEYDQYTILSIAFDVGFNSKSAFYSAFGKFVGETPTSFRKSLSVRA